MSINFRALFIFHFTRISQLFFYRVPRIKYIVISVLVLSYTIYIKIILLQREPSKTNIKSMFKIKNIKKKTNFSVDSMQVGRLIVANLHIRDER